MGLELLGRVDQHKAIFPFLAGTKKLVDWCTLFNILVWRKALCKYVPNNFFVNDNS